MKRILLILSLLLSFPTLRAQTDNPQVEFTPGHSASSSADIPANAPLALENDSAQWVSVSPSADFLCLPGAYGIDALSPAYGSWGDGLWRLHQGFNAQFGLSLSAAFGRHAHKGVGFGQQAAFAYLLPVNNRLSVAAGIFAQNLDWGIYRRTDVGFGAMLAYRASERVNLYAYASKSFLPHRGGFPLSMGCGVSPYFYEGLRSRIGAAAEFKIGQNAMIGVSIEHRTYEY